MAKKLIPMCTFTGQRKIAMKRTWKKLKEMEAEGIPTIGKFGEVLRKNFEEVKREGEKLVKEGKYFVEIEEGK